MLIRTTLLLLAVLTTQAWAAIDEVTTNEIRQLLTFVETSGCRFIRNGEAHSGAQARAHLQKKLDYLQRRHLIGSSEEFIERAASRSSISGNPYEVSCQGLRQPAGPWLNAELERLRNRQ